MTAPDNRNDAVRFLYKHGDLTFSAAHAAVEKLCNNGFRIVRADLADDPAQVKSGPQIAGYTCKGCANFHSEYWSEPSGDGETYDSGTSAKCMAADRNISTYYGSNPTTPDWCPASTIEPQPDPRDAVIARLVEAASKAARIMGGTYDGWECVAELDAALAAAKAVQHD